MKVIASSLSFLFFMLMHLPAYAGTLQVPAHFATIQSAIDAAEDGDVIIVAPGTYAEAISFAAKAIEVRSSGGRDVTAIDATGLGTSALTFPADDGLASVLDGFTVRGGTGTLLVFPELTVVAGGGILIMSAAPSILNCTVTGNSAVYGAGIASVLSSNPTIVDCDIAHNHAAPGLDGTEGAGGGAYFSRSIGYVGSSRFEGNAADLGGGLAVVLSPRVGQLVVEDSTFEENVSSQGGGVNINREAHAIVSRTQFIANTAQVVDTDLFQIGGGLYVYTDGDVLIESCSFTGNASAQHGGGLYVSGQAEVVETDFTGNEAFRGGAIMAFGPLTMSGGEVVGNAATGAGELAGGGGLRLGGSDLHSITGVTFRENTARFGGAARMYGPAEFIACRFESNVATTNGGGLYIETGVVPSEVSDSLFCNNTPQHIWGAANLLGGNTLMDSCPVPGDLNLDGSVDFADLTQLLDGWGECPSGEPAPPCAADVTGDGVADISDLLVLLSNWG